MKKRSISCLSVKISDIHIDEIEYIAFIFKQEKDEEAPTLVLKLYNPNDTTAEVVYDSKIGDFLVPFTPDDTENFKTGKNFYMDTRIKFKDNPDDPYDDYSLIPETDIVTLKMNPTLFSTFDVYKLDGEQK